MLAFAILATFAICLTPAARALTSADQRELQSFTLTEDFLQRFMAMAKEAHDTHTEISLTENDPKKIASDLASLDIMTAQVEKNPQAVAIIERHGLSVRQTVDGSLVLIRASMADAMLASSDG
jgi:hypothetical protein